MPNPPPRELSLPIATWRRVVAAERSVGALQDVLAGLAQDQVHPTLLLGALLRREAIVSSRIEGTLSSARRRRDARPIPPRAELHRVPGQGLKAARFVPPPASEIDPCIADLEPAMHEPESTATLPLFARLALLHYQFECIHAFRGGNGRVGRLLIPLTLRLHRPDCPLVLVSEQLEPQRERYYDLLLDVSRRGAWTEWIDFFLEALERSAADHQRRAFELLRLRERWCSQLSTARSSAALLRVVGELFQRPTVTRQQVAELLDITPPGASKIVQRLVAAGLLVEATGRQRGQVFVSPELLELGSGD